MKANPLRALHALGQSAWLDDIRRGWLADGTVQRWIREDQLAGMTSNPAIFEQAINQSADYDAAIAGLCRAGRKHTEIYETLVVTDVVAAADLFRPVFEETGGRDGFVSLEVSPHLAHDARATVAEAHRLWKRLDRPNVMIKVPGTRAGLPALIELIAGGVNVNVTLLFSVARYREVVEAFLAGLERRAAAGHPFDRVTSVASFFLSRIDTLIDRRLDAIGSTEAAALRGQAAIACARLAYQHYREWSMASRWRALERKGARPQRLLWASTSTKDPSYRDTKYVEALIAPDTVNTVPVQTLAAYRDHGEPAIRIADDLDAMHALPERLAAFGIDLEAVSQQLEDEGVQKFIEPFDRLLATIGRRCAQQES